MVLVPQVKSKCFLKQKGGLLCLQTVKQAVSRFVCFAEDLPYRQRCLTYSIREPLWGRWLVSKEESSTEQAEEHRPRQAGLPAIQKHFMVSQETWLESSTLFPAETLLLLQNPVQQSPTWEDFPHLLIQANASLPCIPIGLCSYDLSLCHNRCLSAKRLFECVSSTRP